MVREGVLDDGIMQMIIQNTREPEDRLLDLKVQIATNVLGAEQITALIERMGSDSIDRAVRGPHDLHGAAPALANRRTKRWYA